MPNSNLFLLGMSAGTATLGNCTVGLVWLCKFAAAGVMTFSQDLLKFCLYLLIMTKI